jgi:hypothetical protein
MVKHRLAQTTMWRRRLSTNCLAITLAALLITPPAWARSVDLDIRNAAQAHPGIHKVLKPYCIDLRKRIEQRWVQIDPHTGETASVVMVIGSTGELTDIQPGEGTGVAQVIAGEAIKQCAPFAPVPSPQPCLLVKATLRSKRPNVDPTPAVNALLGLAMVALAGFSVYALYKWGGSGSTNSSGYVNPQYEYVNCYTRADGTYVPGYRRTVGDGTLMNNYSTQGNINPWTGQPGYVTPYGR